ncbi:MAG: hypothetical protein DRN83_01475 [Hadesarchaea archaeon]|nr:MAG: hypothetical protein DRN83_01475 [Hadesarchaea archaeon]HDI12538.1 PIG-L family deacetylase [Hadesarchaea archaeon]
MKKALIVSPHPDDETLAMGGTILKLKKNNWEVHLLELSFGEKAFLNGYSEEAIKEIRKREIISACREYGVDNLIFGGLPDTKINFENTYSLVKKVIEEIKPDRIYIPSNPEVHQDHLLSAHGAKLAALQQGVKEIFSYEPITLLEECNYYEDISQFLERKLEISKIFKSQMEKYYLDENWIKARAICRGREIKKKAAEGFRVIKMVS